jgi:hypothetical protein
MTMIQEIQFEDRIKYLMKHTRHILILFFAVCWICEQRFFPSKSYSWHIFRYCLIIVPDEIPEQWYCEECIAHEQAPNNPKGNSPLIKPSQQRAQLEFAPLTKVRLPSQTGKVKFIPEGEITPFNDRKYLAKRSPGQFLVA